MKAVLFDTRIRWQVGSCASFDGNGQYISFPTLDFSGLTAGFAFSFWFKDEGSGNWAKVIDFGNGAGADNIVFGRRSGSRDAGAEIFHGGDSQSLVVTSQHVGALRLGRRKDGR